MSTQKKSERYYDLARLGSLDVNHYGIKQIAQIAKNSETILDLGCGEGTRLSYFAKGKTGVGLDINEEAIQRAQKQYPHLKFKVANVEKIPFPSNKFDLVYSAFVFEHLLHPEKVLLEAIRVTKNGGYLGIIAPNYGSPNRASPVFKGSRLAKLLTGLLKDFFPLRTNSLQWRKVNPTVDPEKYEMDLDTVVEPYLGTLLRFLKRNGLKVTKWSSCWEAEQSNPKSPQKIFRMLSSLGLYHFTQWGPHLVVIARKRI